MCEYRTQQYLQLKGSILVFTDGSSVRVSIRKDIIRVGCHTLTREAFEWLAARAAACWKPECDETIIQP